MFSSRRMVLLLAMLTAFGPMSLDLYLPAFPSVAQTYGTDVSAVQLTMTTFLIGLAAGQLVWGPIADRFGRRRPLMFGLGLYIAASLLITIAPSFWIMVALRVLQGLGGASGIVISRAIVRDMFSGSELARAMSIVVSVFAVTPVIGPIIGSLILFVAPWEGMFVFQAVFALTCLIGVSRIRETLRLEMRTSHGLAGAMTQYRAILGNRAFLRIAIVAGFGSAAIQAFISSSPIVFIDGFGASEFGFSLIFAGAALCFTIGAQINVRLVRRHSAANVLRWALTFELSAAVLAVVAALLDASLALYLAPVLFINLGSSGVNTNVVAIALGPFPHAAGSAAALVGAAQMMTGAAMAALLSISMLPVKLELGLFAALAAALGLIVLTLTRRHATS